MVLKTDSPLLSNKILSNITKVETPANAPFREWIRKKMGHKRARLEYYFTLTLNKEW